MEERGSGRGPGAPAHKVVLCHDELHCTVLSPLLNSIHQGSVRGCMAWVPSKVGGKGGSRLSLDWRATQEGYWYGWIFCFPFCSSVVRRREAHCPLAVLNFVSGFVHTRASAEGAGTSTRYRL